MKQHPCLLPGTSLIHSSTWGCLLPWLLCPWPLPPQCLSSLCHSHSLLAEPPYCSCSFYSFLVPLQCPSQILSLFSFKASLTPHSIAPYIDIPKGSRFPLPCSYTAGVLPSLYSSSTPIWSLSSPECLSISCSLSVLTPFFCCNHWTNSSQSFYIPFTLSFLQLWVCLESQKRLWTVSFGRILGLLRLWETDKVGINAFFFSLWDSHEPLRVG